MKTSIGVFYIIYTLTTIHGLLIKPDNIVQKVGVMSPYYNLSFDIKPFAKRNGWRSIIHLTTGGDNEKHGDRTPAVFFQDRSTKLHVCSAISGSKAYCWTSPFELPLNVFSKIRIQQLAIGERVHFQIFVNGIQRLSIENTAPQSFENVVVYAADKWRQHAIAIMENYKLANSDPSLLLKKGNVLQNVEELSPYYDLSFDIKPFSKVNVWSSIIHVTAGGDNENSGDRCPAVFFHTGSTKLHVCSSISGNKGYCWNSPFELPLHVFSNIRIQQLAFKGKTYFRILYNGLQRFIIENKAPQHFGSGQIYAADKWRPPAQAFMKNYKLVQNAMTLD